jgi:apolipoprotein N-acyltransferase
MIDSPLKGWAPLFGVYGVSWAAVTIAAALNVLLTPGVPMRRRAFALGGMVALVLGPALLVHHDYTIDAGPPLAVAAVQGAVPQGGIGPMALDPGSARIGRSGRGRPR